MRVAAVVLIVAALEIACASAWQVVADATDTCRVDDEKICVESIGWLEH
ncbi:hypothetical protein [Paraburkholderia diazotrophica]|uniref:Uncharacterized protein n=1 Tax=Paraburkholderia diazotrophica TaxID=667676 RepID=A0A1H7EQH0_9BURK|nr:hypothetical protein [Paraburkholderia diazotrophica]SEK12985.1 hypothetical protein SAMN05192539_10636 [Paraburkholderia diazotrophica]